MQKAAYEDIYNPAREIQKKAIADNQVDTGDLGSEEANDAAYKYDGKNAADHPDYKAYKELSSTKEKRAIVEPFMDRARKYVEQKLPPSQRNFETVNSWAEQFYRDSLVGATSDDGFGNMKQDQSATADDGFEDTSDWRFTDTDYGKKYKMTSEEFKKDQKEFFEGKSFSSTYARNKAYEEYFKEKYGASGPTLVSDKQMNVFRENAYRGAGGGADFSQITSLPETSKIAESITNTTDSKSLLDKASAFADKHGKSLTVASYLLDAVFPGAGKAIRTAQAVNKGYKYVKGALDPSDSALIYGMGFDATPSGSSNQSDAAAITERLEKEVTAQDKIDDRGRGQIAPMVTKSSTPAPIVGGGGRDMATAPKSTPKPSAPKSTPSGGGGGRDMGTVSTSSSNIPDRGRGSTPSRSTPSTTRP